MSCLSVTVRVIAQGGENVYQPVAGLPPRQERDRLAEKSQTLSVLDTIVGKMLEQELSREVRTSHQISTARIPTSQG